MSDRSQAPRFAVLGAGHGGTAMAAHLAIRGFAVSLYNRSDERIAPIRAQGGIQLFGPGLHEEEQGFARIDCVTTDIREALDGAELVMVVTPANGHSFMAEKCAPYLRRDQIVILHPGRTGGALEFRHVLHTHGGCQEVVVAEAQTLIYAARCNNPGQATVYGVKSSVPVAAIPAHETPRVVKRLRIAYPQFVPGDNVMKTSMDNIGAIFHPAITVLNAARIEATRGEFEYYTEGVTPSVSRVLEALDSERVAVAEALGFRAMTAREWLYVAYAAAGPDLYTAMMANPGYQGIRAPLTIYHRYITEDVPMSLVPIASLGEMLDVPTPTIREIIHLANLMHGRDYWAEGRTVERLGLKGLSVKDIRHLVLEGHVHADSK
ncbi:MAG: NAD/NADP octopine/nopaline dehydrogenase family protein [Armatimonadota bacterium]